MHTDLATNTSATPTAEAPSAGPSRRVAVYWDFENIHRSVQDATPGLVRNSSEGRGRPVTPIVDIDAVMAAASGLGGVVVNKAYCDWTWMGKYMTPMQRHAMTFLHTPVVGKNGKNGADIRLCLDLMADLQHLPHIDHVVVVSGDGDFVPLAQQVRASGRSITGVGTRKSTNRWWEQACDTFIHYEALLPSPPAPAPVPAPVPVPAAPREVVAPDPTIPVRRLERPAFALVGTSEVMSSR